MSNEEKMSSHVALCQISDLFQKSAPQECIWQDVLFFRNPEMVEFLG